MIMVKGMKPVIKMVVLVALAAGVAMVPAQAQNRTNFGLTQPQPTATLPVGLSKADLPVRKTKLKAVSSLTPLKDGDYALNNGWELTDGPSVTANPQSLFALNYNSSDWYNAVVPGTVLTSLVQQGVYPDPYLGLNNMAIPDSLCRKDWWYRIAFSAPDEAAGKLAWLKLDGINYRADIWLNGGRIGHINGAFARGNFEVTDLLKRHEKNVLAVHIYPPSNPGIPHEQSALAGMGPNGGQLALDGPTFISSEGWDWVPGIRDRNIGIWQAVHLRFTGAVTLSDPQVITDLPLPDTTRAGITIKMGLQNHSAQPQEVVVRGSIEGNNFEMPVRLQAGETRQVQFSPATHAGLTLNHPRLWWPNGYGNAALYQLGLEVTNKNRVVTDAATVRFGVRELSYELMVDAPGKPAWRIGYSPTDIPMKKPLFNNVKRREFGSRIFIPSLETGVDTSYFETIDEPKNPFLVIRVNGKRIFCRGGNWGMDDGMKQVNRQRLEPAFQLHKAANFNMIRNWTGESTEEVFYALADEYGLLVWNDFWLSTEGYNLNPLNQRLFLANTLETIRRYRNHPSIAIWCPRNEGYAPDGIEDELYKQLMQEDGTRHYIGNSREINLRQSGDWHFIENPALYFTKYAEGFSTEIGTFSIPVAPTIRKFIAPADQWPINDVWNYHDLHSNNQNLQGYLGTVDSLYGKATGLDDFSRKVQLVNYDSHRAIFEAWNSRLWQNASGVLLWMTHPAWPSMIWQTYSWDFETHGSFFGAKKACERVHVQMNLDNQKVIAINTTLQGYDKAELVFRVYDSGGREWYAENRIVALPENSKTDIFSPDFSAADLPDVYMVRLLLRDAQGRLLSENSYWKTKPGVKDFRVFNQLPEALISVKKLKALPGELSVELENKTASPIIGVKLNLCDAKDNILLPAYFSDGYFTLLPGEKRQVTVGYAGSWQGLKIRTEGYNSPVKTHVF